MFGFIAIEIAIAVPIIILSFGYFEQLKFIKNLSLDSDKVSIYLRMSKVFFVSRKFIFRF
ncbi:MAG: hypothetical protein EAZ76_07235 [Nostocales cyanobacterium]|nr:MAG: hypothetical protein EAZ87_00610 [Nostocales cyanobacterium]TAF16560.1 MAG: hypothetical protein EAZ76_07235 [Nostocales cyanobacterium]